MRLPSWSRFFIPLFLLGSGVLMSASMDSGYNPAALSTSRYSAVEPAQFDIDYLGGHLSAWGHGSGEDHEAAIDSLSNSKFGDSELSLRPIVLAPDNWRAVTERALHVVSATDSARVSMTADAIRIQGVVSDSAAWQTEVRRLQAALPESTELQVDIIGIPPQDRDLCTTAIEDLHKQQILFARSSHELRSSSYAVIDRYVELAGDCGDHSLSITGHTDDVGDPTWNDNLSLARAQSVAGYMVSRGIDSHRLLTAGAGSAQPIADNTTAWGRVRNRRIEIEFTRPN